MRGVLGILLIVVGLEVAYLVLSGKLPPGGASSSSGSFTQGAIAGAIQGTGLTSTTGATGSGPGGDIRPYMFLSAPTMSPISGVPLAQWGGLQN